MQWWQVELFEIIEETWKPPRHSSLGIVNALWSSKDRAKQYIKNHNIALGVPAPAPKWGVSNRLPNQNHKPPNAEKENVFAVLKSVMNVAAAKTTMNAHHRPLLPHTNPMCRTPK